MTDPTATTQEPKLDIDQFYPEIYRRNPALKSAVRGLNFAHLQEGVLRTVSRAVCAMAGELLTVMEHDSPELTLAIQKLREAKDRFVTAKVWELQDNPIPRDYFIQTYPRENTGPEPV